MSSLKQKKKRGGTKWTSDIAPAHGRKKKPPVTSGRETIDCMVCMRGEICSVYREVSGFWELISTDLPRKASKPTFFRLHLRPKNAHFFPPSSSADEELSLLVQCPFFLPPFFFFSFFFLLFSRYPQCVSENIRKSRLIKKWLLSPSCLCSSLFGFWFGGGGG